MIRRAIGELVYDHLIAQNVKGAPSGSKGILLQFIIQPTFL